MGIRQPRGGLTPLTIDGAAMLEMMSSVRDVCKIIISDLTSRNAALVAKLGCMGASLCVSRPRRATDEPLFFEKVTQACEYAQSNPPSAPRSDETVLSASSAKPRLANLTVRSSFPIPKDEEARLAALHLKGLANAARERHFDMITRFTAETTGFPVCLLTFIDRDTQWIKSSFGFAGGSSRRADAFCNYTIACDGPFVVENAATDRRFFANGYVIREPGFRTYAGQPIVSAEGTRLGALCVIDTKVRPVTGRVIERLASISGIVGSMIETRPALAA
jgi:GAF domain-containing protein